MIISSDTNIFVYATDWRDEGKKRTALQLVSEMDRRNAPVGLQVVGELQNVLRRRLKLPLELACQQARNVFDAFPLFGYGREEAESALLRAGAGVLSYWDALLVASAETAGVDVLFSEDMQDGARYGAVTVVNPFAPEGLSARARELLDL